MDQKIILIAALVAGGAYYMVKKREGDRYTAEQQNRILMQTLIAQQSQGGGNNQVPGTGRTISQIIAALEAGTMLYSQIRPLFPTKTTAPPNVWAGDNYGNGGGNNSSIAGPSGLSLKLL